MVSTSANPAATLEVSAIGEQSCPTWEPDATAPATNGSGTPILCAIANMITPTVPAVPQEVPMMTETIAVIRNDNTTINVGLIILIR